MGALSRTVVLSLLFVSGASGLVYELVWSKRLANVLGNSGQAHAIVLATFMGGLALGAFAFGRLSDRVRRPLHLYGLLELGVGAYALVFAPLLDLLARAYLQVAPSLDGAPRTAVKLVLAAAALVVPTVLMGGSVPALTKALTSRVTKARSSLSLLYAFNSLGASAGVLLAGVWLVPAWGLLATERGAAAINCLIGALAVVLAFRSQAAPADGAALGTDATETEPAPQQYGAPAVRAALLATALSGFTSMLFEVTWVRLLAIVLGGTTYAFTLILCVFILGIGLGSLWLQRRPDRTDSLRTFALLQLALLAAVCLALPYYERLPYLFHHLLASLHRADETWPLFQALSFVFAGSVLLVPTFIMGASFPSIARVALSSVESLGGQLGRVYLANTAGTVSGSLLAGLWLLPLVGLEGNFAVGLLLTLAAAAVAYKGAGWPGRSKLAVPVVGVFASVFVIAMSGWSTTAASSGRYREWLRTFSGFQDFKQAVKQRSSVRFVADDVFASVLVGQTEAGHRYMRINGKIDASNGDDVDTQVMAGHLGFLLHRDRPKRVLLIGLGAGITAGSLLTHELERLDIVEISPAVVDAARLFADDNHHALDDPRTHLTIDDARTFLQLSPQKYDLIVSVPSNPWVSGVAGLFSRDFFHIAQTHLAPGGRIVQWIHTYESNGEMVRMVVRTLRDTFAHGTTWVGPQDLVMVAADDDITIDPGHITAQLAAPAVASDLKRAGVTETVVLLARQMHDDHMQKAFGGDGPVNTDDLNRLEFGSAQAYFSAHEERVADGRTASNRGSSLALATWLLEHPLDANQAAAIYRAYASVHDDPDPLLRSAAERWLTLAPDDEAAMLAVARSAFAQRDVTAAAAALKPAIDRGSNDPAAVTLWLKARAKSVRRAHSLWLPSTLSAELELGERVLAAHPDDQALQAAVAEVRKP